MCPVVSHALPTRPPSHSEALTSRRLEFAGAGLGQGSEQSEMTHAGIRLRPWPPKHYAPAGSANRAPESLSFVWVHVQQGNLQSLPGCSKNVQTKISCVSPYLEDPVGSPEFGATKAEPNPFLMVEESRGLVETLPPPSVVMVSTSHPPPTKSPGHAVPSPWHRVDAQCTSEMNLHVNELVR